jgi:hypothetical protein
VANLSGQQITLPRPPPNPNAVTGLFINSPITADQNSVLTDQQATYASYYGPSSDTADNAWRIQKDTDPLYATVGTSTASATVAPVESYLPGTGIFVNQRNVNQDYYADVHTTIPYTDGKGYEVIAPFPWGRYIDLKTALQEFTRDGYVVQSEATAAQNTVQTLQNTQTALFAGLDQPTGSADPASSAIAALNTTAGTTNNPPNSSTTKAQFTTVVGTDGSELLGADDKPIMVLQFPQTVLNKANITVFELDYSGFNASSNSTITQGQPDTLLNSELVQNTTTVEQTKLNVFLTGAVVQSGSAIGTQNQALANSGAPQNISKGTATAPPVTAPVVAAPAFSGSVIPG